MTRFIYLILFLTAMSVIGAQNIQAEETKKDEAVANFKEVELNDFISFVSRFTGNNFVFNKSNIPGTKITMHAKDALSQSELLSILKNVLSGNNLELIKKDSVYHIVQPPVAQKMADSYTNSDSGKSDEDIMTTIVQLEANNSPQDIEKFVKPLLSRYGITKTIQKANSLLIRDTQFRIQKIKNIMDTVQNMSKKWKVKITPIKKAKAENTSKKINAFFRTLKEKGQMQNPPVVLPIKWSNSILISGEEEHINTVDRLIDNIDKVSKDNIDLKVYDLKNAKSSAAVKVVRNLLIQKAKSSDSEFIVTSDDDTNSLFIFSDPQMTSQVDKIIKHVDKALSQVFVEALIVETSLEHSQQFGIEWLGGGEVGGDSVLTGGFVDPNSNLAPLMSSASLPVAPGGFSIGALGNAVTFAGKQFATLGTLVNFLKSASDFNILSTPRIITLDNSPAEVFVGENRPFKVSERIDSENNVIESFDYRDIGIKLNVVPTINKEDNMVRLKIEQDIQNVVNSNTEQTAPTTLNRYTKTNVQIPNGSTMVISGLIKNEKSSQKKAVPGLSNIPGVGGLFKSESSSNPKTTLMVFIRVKIIDSFDEAKEITDKSLNKVDDSKQKYDKFIEKEYGSSSANTSKDVFSD